MNAHFRALHEIVAAEAGAVVKTIGDAVMATFPTPDRAVAAALRMRDAMRDLDGDLVLKIGIHEGPCLAVMLNERQDYFGQTVNIASRVQGLATSTAIFATDQVVRYDARIAAAREQRHHPNAKRAEAARHRRAAVGVRDSLIAVAPPEGARSLFRERNRVVRQRLQIGQDVGALGCSPGRPG